MFFLRNPTELGGARSMWAVKWKNSLAKNPTELGGARRVWALMCKHRMARERLSACPEATARKQGARCCKRFAWRVSTTLQRVCNVQEHLRVYSMSSRIWAEPADATRREQGHDGGWSSSSPSPTPGRWPLISGASRSESFALASLHFFPGPFHFACFCSFANGRIGAACCRSRGRCTSLASLCLRLLKSEGAVVTNIVLPLVERRVCFHTCAQCHVALMKRSSHASFLKQAGRSSQA